MRNNSLYLPPDITQPHQCGLPINASVVNKSYPIRDQSNNRSVCELSGTRPLMVNLSKALTMVVIDHAVVDWDLLLSTGLYIHQVKVKGDKMRVWLRLLYIYRLLQNRALSLCTGMQAVQGMYNVKHKGAWDIMPAQRGSWAQLDQWKGGIARQGLAYNSVNGTPKQGYSTAEFPY